MKDTEKNTEKKSGKGFKDKASEVGKKMVSGIQKGMKNLSEQSQKKRQEKEEQRQKKKKEKDVEKYNPLFPEVFQSEDFHLPNLICIVDDAERRDIDVCEGAIGWRETVKGVEVLYLYDEYVTASNIMFVPFASCDAVYAIDPFEKGKFINTDMAFERTLNEKLAELEQIAYCLGAKSCSIEIVTTDDSSLTVNVEAKANFASFTIENETEKTNKKTNRLKNVTYFEGNEKPQMPKLKWFAFDENINGLIDMRCLGKNAIKSKVLELSCSTSATMSHKTAISVDEVKTKGMKKGAKIGVEASAAVKSMKELSSKLIFEVEF